MSSAVPRVELVDVCPNDPEAEKALRMIIERETTAAVAKTPTLDATIHTASIGGETIRVNKT